MFEEQRSLGDGLNYSTLVEAYEMSEAITKHLEMTGILVDLFTETPPEVIDKVIYLTQGKLHPDWMGLPEIGIAEKMAAKVFTTLGLSSKEFEVVAKETGDIGLAAEKLLKKRPISPLMAFRPLTVEEVYDDLDTIAKQSGSGSTERKIRRLGGLISRAKPKEARYILRSVTGKLRLGVGDMTVLEALAIAYTAGKKEKEAFNKWIDITRGRIQASTKEKEEIRVLLHSIQEKKELLERAYNISSDLGYVAKIVSNEGLEGTGTIRVTLGKPVRMMMAQRLPTAEEIIEKLEGACFADWKMDGERFQFHKRGDEIDIYSRRLERITPMYPDASALALKCIKVKNAIIEGECVAIHPDTGELQPFQVLMQRRRKYDIKKMMKEVPIAVYLFDCLYIDGEDLTQRPYPERRKRLEEILHENQKFKLTPILPDCHPQKMERFFDEAVSEGCEGLIIKSTGPESIYRAGARSWLWVKWKRSYQSMMIEPIDLVVVGAYMGRGKRAGTYGALLTAAYDGKTGIYKTICKVGSGFTDEVLENLPKKLEPHIIQRRDANVEAILDPDVWFKPTIVIEILGDEITLSPVHTCGFDVIREGSGMAVRFPRFTGRWRPDKSPDEATTEEEIIEMYRMQLKKLA